MIHGITPILSFPRIILIAARLLSETAARFGIPSVIGELVAGLLIGPSLLGWVSPDTAMKLLAEIELGLGVRLDAGRIIAAGRFCGQVRIRFLHP